MPTELCPRVIDYVATEDYVTELVSLSRGYSRPVLVEQTVLVPHAGVVGAIYLIVIVLGIRLKVNVLDDNIRVIPSTQTPL